MAMHQVMCYARHLKHPMPECRVSGWNGVVSDMDAAAALLCGAHGMAGGLCCQPAVCCMRHAGLHEGDCIATCPAFMYLHVTCSGY